MIVTDGHTDIHRNGQSYSYRRNLADLPKKIPVSSATSPLPKYTTVHIYFLVFNRAVL